jgi:hypothetical protein
MQETERIKDRELLNIVYFSFWALVEAVQLIILVAFVFSFIPFKPHPFAVKLFLLHQHGIQPERDMFFYRLFAVTATVLFGAGLYIFHRRLNELSLSKSLLKLTMTNAFWVFVQLFAIFKIFVTANPDWARYLLYAAFAGAVVSRVFWPEIRTWIPKLSGRFGEIEHHSSYAYLWNMIIPAFVVVLLFIPDLTKVLARIFVRDQFYHLDSFLMAPGWAHLKGLVLNKDAISEYSVVIPVVVSHIAQWIGGFNYHNVLVILIAASILYFIGFYFFLRRWLGSSLVAAFGTLLGIKLQMFHWGVSPIIWQFPSATVIRYVFDLPVLWLLWLHCLSGRKNYLWLAAGFCGISLAYMVDTGIYLLVSFYMYLVLSLLWSESGWKTLKSFKSACQWAGLFIFPFVVGLLVLLIVQGPSIFSRQFWGNTFEFSGLFLQGWGALPVMDGLKDRQFFAFIMGFVIPVVYAATAIFVGALCFLRQIDRKNILAVIFCIYGLGLYHYFVNRSAVSSYYVVGIPFVAIICYWLRKFSATLSERYARIIQWTAVGVMVPALMTSYFVTYYPNIFNLAGHGQWEEEIKFYKQEFDLSRDVQLISRLTSDGQPVAVISSFETKLLMDAKRKPFFYYFPLVESSHMRLAHFRGTYLHTRLRLQKTMAQLEEQKPQYVFIEGKLFRRNIPPQYFEVYQTLETIVQYLGEHYEPVEDGQYLVALKRK